MRGVLGVDLERGNCYKPPERSGGLGGIGTGSDPYIHPSDR